MTNTLKTHLTGRDKHQRGRPRNVGIFRATHILKGYFTWIFGRPCWDLIASILQPFCKAQLTKRIYPKYSPLQNWYQHQKTRYILNLIGLDYDYITKKTKEVLKRLQTHKFVPKEKKEPIKKIIRTEIKKDLSWKEYEKALYEPIEYAKEVYDGYKRFSQFKDK